MADGLLGGHRAKAFIPVPLFISNPSIVLVPTSFTSGEPKVTKEANVGGAGETSLGTPALHTVCLGSSLSDTFSSSFPILGTLKAASKKQVPVSQLGSPD